MKHTTYNKIASIIKQFSRTRILVVGDLMLDQFIWGKVSRISPEAPVPVVHINKQSYMPGGAANVAASIKALGGKSIIAGIIGNDRDGRMLKALLGKLRVDKTGVVTDKSSATTLKTRVIAQHQHVVRIDREKPDHLSKAATRKIISAIKKAMTKVDVIIIEDYGKGLITRDFLKTIISEARRKKKMILVDPKEENIDCYRKISGMTPNKFEAEITSGIKIKDQKTLEKAGRKLLRKTEGDFVLITQGEGGMALFEKGKKSTCIQTVAQDVYDVSGAGDTVIGTLALALSAGASKQEAAFIANCAAGVVVGKVGVASASPKELLLKAREVLEKG